jgi:M6 family metalloprotease-like protein
MARHPYARNNIKGGNGMSRLLMNLLVLAILMLIAVPAIASDLSKAIIYDVPDHLLEKQFGPIPKSQLTDQESREMKADKFDGDTLKILVVLLEWTNRLGNYPSEVFDSVFFSDGVYSTGSISDYFHEVSYGQVATVGTVIPWYNAGTYDGNFEYWDFEDILYYLDATVDFSQFDGNSDGIVDAMIFLRSGNGQEDSGDPNDIWSYALTYYPGYGPGPFDGVVVSHWCTAPEMRPLRDSANPHIFSGVDTLNTISVAAHELSHNLGLPDLYDYDGKLDTMSFIIPGDYNDHPFVDWCLMGYNGYGLMAIKKIIPPHLAGWCKKELGWITPIILDQPEYQDLVIYDIEMHQDSSLYKIPIDMEAGEYFLLEYRNPNSAGMFDKFDSDFSVYLWPYLTFGCDPLERGLLISHVDDSIVGGSHYVNNGTPDYPHYTVAVEDAGYNPDHDAYSNPSGFVTDSAQWWYPYETRKAAPFTSEVPGKEIFSPATYPNSDGYNGPSGIYVRVDSIVDEKLYAYIARDGDYDGVPDSTDNCPEVYNPDQIDDNGNDIGDACESSYTCGDANGDSVLNIFDITYLITYLYLDGPPPDPIEAGYVNGDDLINIFDITHLITYLYLEGPAPICP